MNAIRWTVMLLAISVVTFVGCNSSSPDGASGDSNSTTAAASPSTDTTTVAVAILCGKCGEVKGSAACCADGAEICECGMHKGSALCCAALPTDAKGQDICSQCGHVAAAGHVCDEDCETCPDCGLHKGSPACCKLKS